MTFILDQIRKWRIICAENPQNDFYRYILSGWEYQKRIHSQPPP